MISSVGLASLVAHAAFWLLLGPDCSINPDTPEALLHAAAAVVRKGA